ncbi:MAG: hypothetical protein C4542_02920 [Dehalococcoidia bacterium]|nr:MAG: hypothetical protein C4542_02920 [Dehalococcoidia bacterium]
MQASFHIGWPEAIYLANLVGEVVLVSYRHGQPKGNYNAPEHIITWLLITALLYWGGFFN